MPFILGLICLPMIALSDVLQGMARANSWALFALSPTYLMRPVLILAFMGAAHSWPASSRDAETAIIAAILATYATTIVQLVGVTARIDRRLPPGPRKIHFRAVVRRVAADLPGRELLLPAHQRRRADGRLLHAARRRRGLFRHRQDAGAGAFRLFRRQGRRRPALRRRSPMASRTSSPASPARRCPGRSGRRCSWRWWCWRSASRC